MSRHRRRCPDTNDLLAWEAPQPVKAFQPETIRAASLGAQLSKAISRALKECGKTRDQVVKDMSSYLGSRLTEDMLNKYASEAAEDQIINVVRFIGLIHVTRDRRLLQMVASHFGWAVVEEKHVDAIKLAVMLEEREAMNRNIEATRRNLQSKGGL
ncbi:DNA transposition protein [Microvirga terricola]|uniref:DNA transposition protein n=1 Tax=Microvirga terricola TaxID=2719797 RepID=A0ABX0VC57_9HYPH|nr:DNA transposition protein [Microvirga terricola]NIX75417.1 DNA transposition protein [Microvirga terricola]